MDNVTVIVDDLAQDVVVKVVQGGIKGDKGDIGLTGEQGLKGDDYASIQIENVILTLANWNLVGGFWEYDYANVLILATSLVNIVPYNDTIDFVKDAYIMPMVVSDVGTVKIYAAIEPLGDMNVLIEIV